MGVEANYSFGIILFLIGIIFVIIFLWIIEPRLNKRTVSNNNEHGSSKFAEYEEIKEKYETEDLNNIIDAGFPLYYEKDKFGFKKVIFDNRSPHWTIVGSTGSGKSATLVIPECVMFAKAKNKHSLIVTDPKGEIFSKTSKIFQTNGYDVITIDFRNPRKSNKINLMQPIIDQWLLYCKYDKKLFVLICYFIINNNIQLDDDEDKLRNELINIYEVEDYIIDYIINRKEDLNHSLENHDSILYDKSLFWDISNINEIGVEEYIKQINNEELKNIMIVTQNESSLHYAEANRQVATLSDLLFVDKDAKDQFWLSSAKHLFCGITGIFLEDYKEGLIPVNKINMTSIKKFQTSSLIKENQTYLQKNVAQREYGTLSKDSLNSILYASENTYKSITSVFADKMNVFDDLNVENITCKSDFEFEQLGRKPTIMYLIVPDENKIYFQLVTIIVGILYQSLVKFATNEENNGTLPVKVEWILDEFANCPPLEDIDGKVSVARSRGMRFQFFIQSFSQLEAVYSKTTADNILDNTALCYLKTNNYNTAEVISKKLGKSTITTSSINKNTDPIKISANQTTSLIGRELLTPNEVISLEYKTIIFPTYSNPIKRDTYLYNNIFKEMNNTNVISRKTNILTKNTSLYYTVEELRYNYENELEIKFNKIVGEERNINFNNSKENKDDLDFLQEEVKSIFNSEKVSFRNNNDIFLNIKKAINGFEINKLLNTVTHDFDLRVEVDKQLNETIIEIKKI